MWIYAAKNLVLETIAKLSFKQKKLCVLTFHEVTLFKKSPQELSCAVTPKQGLSL